MSDPAAAGLSGSAASPRRRRSRGRWMRVWRRLPGQLAHLVWALRPAALLAALEAEQDRWFLWLPVLLGCGIGLYFALPTEPPVLVAAGALSIGLGLLLATGGSHDQTGRLIGGTLLTVALGFGLAQARTVWVGTPTLTQSAGSVLIAGWIEDVEARGASAYRIIIRAATIEGGEVDGRTWAGTMPYRVRVRVPSTSSGGANAQLLRIGAPVRLRARLNAPPLPALPGDYDFARRAYFLRLGAVGYARAAPQPAPDLGDPPWTIAIWAPGENLRRVVAERILAVLGQGDRAAIATALIQGDQGGISQTAMTIMRNSGLAHILSISGLHLAIVAGALFWSIRALLALSPTIAQVYPVRAMAAIAAGFGALFYLMLSGWQVPAVRSFVMIAIMFLSIVLARPALSLRNVAMAALLLLALRPDNLLDVSFLMSFAATVGLVALYEELGERRRLQIDPPEPAGPIRRLLRLLGADLLTTLVAGAAVAPLGAYFFHNYQHYAALGNLLALPIVSLWLMPAVLVVLVLMPFGLDALALEVMAYGVDALLLVGTWVASLPGAVSAIPAMPLSAVVAMMLGGIWLALWRRPWRWLGLIAAGLGCWKALDRVPPDVLIGRDGEALAIRQADGLLSAIGGKQGAYELQRWLEHDGDRRTPAAVARGQGFRCDQIGCTARVGGLTLAYLIHPAGLADECGPSGEGKAGEGKAGEGKASEGRVGETGGGSETRAGKQRGADIIVLRFRHGTLCSKDQLDGRLLVDLIDLRRSGTHIIRIVDGRPTLTTLAEHRGDRPWTRGRPAAPLPRQAGAQPGAGGPGAAHERLFDEPIAREQKREDGSDPW